MSGGFHEPLVRHEPTVGPSDRSFGLTVGGILAAIGVVRSAFHWEVGVASAVMLAIASVLIVLALVRPTALAGANRRWMQLGALLARIVNPLVLFVVYAVAFVPIGLFLRLRGYDLLRLKPAAAGGSYWINRTSDTMVERMTKQF